MGRTRKEKGGATTVSEPKAGPSKPTKKSKKAGADGLKEHVQALGGDDADVQMLSGVKDGMVVQGDIPGDANLSKDVSRFLKGLSLGSSGEPSTSAPKQKKEKKDKKAAHAPANATAEPTPKPAEKAQEKKAGKDKKREEKKKDNKGKEKDVKRKQDSAPKPSTSSAIPTLAPPKSGKMLFAPASDWYNLVEPLPAPSNPLPTPSSAQISSLTSTASSLHTSELSSFSSGSNSGLVSTTSDQAFLKNILSSGTLSDRLSALTLMAQSSPLHNTRALEVLKNMAEKGRGGGGAVREGDKGKAGSRDERLKAARAIVDWWVGGGSPPRKLKYFRDQPLLHPDITNKHLLVWYFEDWLKKYFFSLLQVLEMLSLDTLPYVRMQALTFIYQLLRERPEQEHNLLRLLINKLGDTDKAVCSRASYYILQLLQSFPDMKTIVIRETTALIMRPAASSAASSSLTQSTAKPNTHIKFTDDDHASKEKEKAKDGARPQDRSTWNVHARYYAAITFNQIVLSAAPKDREAARALMDVYFRLFRDVVGERSSAPADLDDNDDDEGPEKTTKGAGLNKGRDAWNGAEGKARRRATRSSPKSIQGAAGFAEVQDSNSRLVSAILTGVNRAMPFAKFGGLDVEFEGHMDTLFLISHTSTFNITVQALTLVHHVVAGLQEASGVGKGKMAESGGVDGKGGEKGKGTVDAVISRYYRTLYATLFDPRVFTSNKQAMYLNLVYKSLKGDTDTERVKAFVRRFCQVLAGGFGGNEFVAGGLWLLGELWGNVPGLREGTLSRVGEDEEDEEGKDVYDPRKREPEYAHASASPLWELTPLLNYFHPAISLLATQLLSGQPLTSSPDLSLHTLTHFLDRFVYKNPKKTRPKGDSAMQPAAAPEGEGVRKLKGDLQEGPVNESGWWRRDEGKVPVDQLFFHKYFSQKHARETDKKGKVEKRKGKKDGDGESDEDGESGDEEEDVDNVDESDEEEAEIWKAMKASMPKEAGDDDLDGDAMSDVDDDLPSDLPSDFGGDSDDDIPVVDEDAEEDAALASEPGSDAATDEEEEEPVSEDEAFSLAEDSDADDLLDLDAEVPDGLIHFPGTSLQDPEQDEGEEWGGFDDGASKKRKRKEEEKSRRQKLRSLPTFASYEDYAKMIEDAPEDDI
ncbi:CBF-domain-containing protein [Peniophora sp. CONT]|nr:CBF-domain-containing protein [Peniophora sp. CONT]